MRSRNYYAIVVGSSLLLFTVSCKSQQRAKGERKEAPSVVDRTLVGDPDDKKDEGKHTANHGPCVPSDEIEVEPFIHNTSVADDGGSQEMTGGDFPVSPLSKKTKDGCAVGAMPFEGKCVNKGKIDRILERRERKALKRVQKAHKPQQMADAAGELIEQQIAQMGKAEDDLDEILEQLRAEDLEERREKKEGP